MIVWRLGGNIIRAVLCGIVCNSCVPRDVHTREQFFHLHIGFLIFACWFRLRLFVCVCLGFALFCAFCVIMRSFYSCVVLGLVSSVPSRD